MVVMSSPFSRFTTVVLPALSRPLRRRGRARQARRQALACNGALGLRPCGVAQKAQRAAGAGRVHHEDAHLLLLRLDLLDDREEAHCCGSTRRARSRAASEPPAAEARRVQSARSEALQHARRRNGRRRARRAGAAATQAGLTSKPLRSRRRVGGGGAAAWRPCTLTSGWRRRATPPAFALALLRLTAQPYGRLR